MCRTFVLGAMLILLSVGFLCLAGARLNLTPSLPMGVYWVSHQSIAHGSYVRFCPPAEGAFALGKERGYLDAGYCSSGYIAMIKRVGGMMGDRVEVNEEGTWINGKFLPLSARLNVDSKGRFLPKTPHRYYELQSTQMWVISDTNDQSFDSRYFGPIDQAWVVEVVRPLITWGHGGTLEQTTWSRKLFSSL